MSLAEPTHLIVDRKACAGHGLCYGSAPDLVDCDDQGDPILPDRALTDDEIEAARVVVEVCPERALSLSTLSAEQEQHQ